MKNAVQRKTLGELNAVDLLKQWNTVYLRIYKQHYMGITARDLKLFKSILDSGWSQAEILLAIDEYLTHASSPSVPFFYETFEKSVTRDPIATWFFLAKNLPASEQRENVLHLLATYEMLDVDQSQYRNQKKIDLLRNELDQLLGI